MKYSLRSLMIVVSLICVLLGGRIEYLRRWALYHENQASIFGRAGAGFTFLAENHEVQAGAYRRALWRPWTVIDESPTMQPPTGPIKFIRDLVWLAFVTALVVVWWFDRRRMIRRIESLEGTARPNPAADPALRGG